MSPNEKLIAYFCSEFAIDNELPTYSGGLGVLAGDLMNAAADQNYPMIGVGILYKGKEYIQHITGDGKEEKRDSEFDHDSSFLRPVTKEDHELIVEIPFDTYTLKIKSYYIRLSDKVILYFLSTDVDGNPGEWISDMDALYKGDSDSQIRQQILLGIGGVKLLNSLNLNPSVYHINEGRPSFIIWEMVSKVLRKEKIPFEEAWKLAKEKIVYTNHTLIPAGNLQFPRGLVEKWAKPFASKMGVESEFLIKDGLLDKKTFSISLFALNTSKKHSTVSKIHKKYAQAEWPKYRWISITNGVHFPRWQDSDFRKNLNDRDMWELHKLKKRELVNTVLKRTGFAYDPQRLVISWARRLAEYKQPKEIFKDITRLKKILENPQMPVQLLLAGNSHSADPNAKSIIEEIIRLFATELSGHAIFIPNYNISLANHLVSGSDLWLNTPKGNLEACGTSGMKAISNGVLNCTVLDGWTYEVDWQGVGWILDPEKVAESFYNILETEIVPLYYQRDQNNPPQGWIERMRQSIEVSKNFSAEKMFEEYKERLYSH
ncbi:hypothetical protein A2686_03685 [Candidatus Woesebacteria bacterium RIFCSPHIGHO2_01_FULL_38_10]|uniref:Alpha-glucan phosphorylase n=1 Tax=Candidatus Woesebacteria bacterium RIFCSPLOWO2_01_FULL_39_10b TaxID=1802517 RepID=A0A1F8B6H1_9BACT|nr:MAG: hypothetical protein A2686_03685 [Candidatus Woesebacteria bacterium RIFCSPHIGHO2_01_FULL_38_10]OGM59642.1 MAG: hypothetical protein A2892_03900 [Candidatus Woesebacteria bacterium RIFCSPLOWO2_01_FULL_39_10b]